jgi:hypothetical protein
MQKLGRAMYRQERSGILAENGGSLGRFASRATKCRWRDRPTVQVGPLDIGKTIGKAAARCLMRLFWQLRKIR